jgi:hypothetical protein
LNNAGSPNQGPEHCGVRDGKAQFLTGNQVGIYGRQANFIPELGSDLLDRFIGIDDQQTTGP